MGERDVAQVDVQTLRADARRYQSVADSLSGGVLPQLRLSFGAACAGRDHAGRGESVRLALEQYSGQVRMWSRAAAETAAALQATADRYVATDAVAAGRIG